MNKNSNNDGTFRAVETNGSWLKDKIGKPLFWIAIGFITCKALDAYTETKRARRLSS